jgi:two-component system chemotaxis response regulator CheB
LTGEKGESGNVLRLTRNEPENYCRPAVDPMLGSLAPLYGSRLLAIVPTGIGSDGCKGSQAVAAAGGCSADFDTPAKTRVLEGMANMLAPDGFLYLGGAETVLGETDRLQIMQGRRGVCSLAAPDAERAKAAS